MKALLIVDVQKDFCPGGALGVDGGDEVVPVINKLKERFEFVLASKDWHPKESVHFEKWPKHCIQASEGAEFHDDLDLSGIHHILLKGTSGEDDGYSAFEATNVDLHANLKQAGIDKLYVAGLTTEYCVKNTALDAARKGFETYVVEDAIRPVNAEEGDEEKAKQAMQDAGVGFINSKRLLGMVHSTA